MTRANQLLKIYKFRISVILFSLVTFAVLNVTHGIQWLTLGKETVLWNYKNKASQCRLARKNYGFVRQQEKICRNSFEVMPFVVKAAEETIQTCQQLFEKRRWNCSSILTAPDYTLDLVSGTREQAFVYALSSAALTHTVSRACASGSLFNCSCSGHPNYTPKGNFKWGGCGDNIHWSILFGKRFTDSVEKAKQNKEMKKKKRGDGNLGLQRSVSGIMTFSRRKIKGEEHFYLAAINIQNNRAGRKVTEMSLKIQCKCHGVSGSCSIKICWKALPRFLEIGERLQKKYGTALEVIPRKLDFGKKLISIDSESFYRGGDNLVFTTKSPDYCFRDDRTGSFGTKGRHCNKTSYDYDSCEIMCCGRGHVTVTVQKVEMCKCKFHWCCNVVCKKCLQWVDMHICN